MPTMPDSTADRSSDPMAGSKPDSMADSMADAEPDPGSDSRSDSRSDLGDDSTPGRRARREADLVAYYTNEVPARADRELPPERVARRTAYLKLLERENRRSVLEVGPGPGRDAGAFAEAGLAYTGVDLTPDSVTACRSLGLEAHVASVLDLPFEDATFTAGWTMSTLLHIADQDLDRALTELVRVLHPNAPLAIGLWGDQVSGEREWDDGTGFGPPRFFSARTDDDLREALSRHGNLEEWVTWTSGIDALHYQWAVLRTPA
jgi:SAM-dependent methyltransferase